jgi:hypothetical protein
VFEKLHFFGSCKKYLSEHKTKQIYKSFGSAVISLNLNLNRNQQKIIWPSELVGKDVREILKKEYAE